MTNKKNTDMSWKKDGVLAVAHAFIWESKSVIILAFVVCLTG